MDGAVTERRAEERLGGSSVRQIATLVRPGQWVLLIDVSVSGALVAGRRPLRPGARVEVHFRTAGHRAAVWAMVVRCSVAAMDADRVVYHAGLNFERPAEWVRERATQSVVAVPPIAPQVSGTHGQWLPGLQAAVEVIDMEAAE